MAVPRTYRYSPLNWLIVDWGRHGIAFEECGLPDPLPCKNDNDPCETACVGLPIAEAIDTYDWERWLPEVIVGIEDPDEEIAASYVRQAAIDFCRSGRVLQRQIIVELQPDTTVYPVQPYEGESIQGVIGVRLGTGSGCWSEGCSGRTGPLDWQLDIARNELTATGATKGLLSLLVWSAPTEDACVHDVFLYNQFRREITAGARLHYATAVHFRDRMLMASLPTQAEFERAIVVSKRKAMNKPSMSFNQPGSGMWGGAGPCCPSREASYFHRER